LPFYFCYHEKRVRYYRFGTAALNYTKLKDLSSFYLIFALSPGYSMNIRVNLLFNIAGFVFSNIFASKKYLVIFLIVVLLIPRHFV
jgi:hypothetical protein